MPDTRPRVYSSRNRERTPEEDNKRLLDAYAENKRLVDAGILPKYVGGSTSLESTIDTPTDYEAQPDVKKVKRFLKTIGGLHKE